MSKTLTVASTASFSSRCIIPLLPKFYALYPDVQIRIVYATKSTDTIDYDIDILIRNWDGPYVGPYESHTLLSGATQPVCSHSLLDRIGSQVSAADWAGINLLHDENHNAWGEWFDSAGIKPPDLNKGTTFEDFNLLSTAAVAGHGVALSPVNLVKEDIIRGHLAILSNISANRDRNYLFLHRKQGGRLVNKFRDWLLAEVGEYFHNMK
ncbi:LysR substrate-binding domain-containing protein [Dasania marina]|uniref:LysR substrate-binding domain-containing protein n=1 Tax=Dasania marina TaxID=471499 RepID=UPI0030DDC0FC|tara:strand:+ start:37363 stop:37989 length:627 start_codon:yes stop_codon:yes gene_type:complete